MDNISKIMWYLEKVAVDPIKVYDPKKDKETIYFGDVKSIKFNSTFFNTDDCISCGCCCVTEDNVFTQHEYDLIQNMTDEEFNKDHPDLDPENLHKLRKGIIKEIRVINGIEQPLYIYKLEKTTYFVPSKGPEGKTVDRCTWQTHQGDKFYCGIHPVESITCIIPHMRWFFNNKRNLSIGTSQYGRNWALGCPIKFSEPSSELQFNQIKNSRIEKFKHLNKCAEDLQIKTYLPLMIQYAENLNYTNYKFYLNHDILDVKKHHLF